jgi:hypothetical protein
LGDGIIRIDRAYGWTMSQVKASSPELIYEALTDDAAFMNLVGTRTFSKDNTVLDAISIVSPGADLPLVKAATGMEVVIHDLGSLTRREYVTNDMDINTTWKVFLLAWPGANGSILHAAAARIMEIFTKATAIETVPLPDGLGAIAQILVMIPSESIIL